MSDDLIDQARGILLDYGSGKQPDYAFVLSVLGAAYDEIERLRAEVALYYELEGAVRTSRQYPGLGVDAILARIRDYDREVRP